MAKRQFTATVTHEDEWFVAQCLEVDVASQGESVESALENLREALTLYCEHPHAEAEPVVCRVEIEVGAAGQSRLPLAAT